MHNTWLEFLTPMVCRYVYNIHPVYWLLRDKKSGEPWKFYQTKNFRIFPEMKFLNFWSFIFFEICIDFAGTRLCHGPNTVTAISKAGENYLAKFWEFWIFYTIYKNWVNWLWNLETILPALGEICREKRGQQITKNHKTA